MKKENENKKRFYTHLKKSNKRLAAKYSATENPITQKSAWG